MRNGVVVSVSSFARVLTDLGHAVTIFTARHPDQVDHEEGVVRFPSINLPIRAQYPLPIPVATGEARALLAETPFDVVHSNSPMLLGQFAASYHKRRGVPLVFTYHTLIEEYTHYLPLLPQAWARREAILLSRKYCNSADHNIAPSRYVASRLRYYRVVKPISVIPTGIDIDLIDQVPKGTFRRKFRIPADVPLLAYAGRIAKEKNIPRLLTAFRQVLQTEPDAHLVLIGGGPHEAETSEMVQELGIAHRTRLTGFVPREQVIQGLKAADIFVFASLTETQGLVIGEAMSCRTPVVAVSADTTREIVAEGSEGLLVPDDDGPFADAVITLLNDKKLRRAMSDHARLRAESTSAQRCTERLVEVYHRVIEHAPLRKPVW